MNRRGITRRQSWAGFTLTEMLMVVLIVGVMLTVAIPNFAGLFARNALSAKMNEIVGAVQLARSEAVTRNQLVTICRRNSDGSDSCDGAGGWQNGWIAFVESLPPADGGTNGTIDAGETIIGSAGASQDFRFIGNLGTSIRMSFRPDGSLGAGGDRTMIVCKGTAYEGVIEVEMTGRPSSRRLDAVDKC